MRGPDPTGIWDCMCVYGIIDGRNASASGATGYFDALAGIHISRHQCVRCAKKSDDQSECHFEDGFYSVYVWTEQNELCNFSVRYEI